MTHNIASLLSVMALPAAMLVACAEEVQAPPTEPPDPTDTTGGTDNTFDHDNNGLSPYELLDRLREEGPIWYSSRVHSCAKVRVATMDNLLASRGVNMSDNGPTSPGGLYLSGQNALGQANYVNRVRENIELTTASASRLFDIFVAAAPELITNLDTSPACTGVGPLFDVDNKCNSAAFSCLLGVPVTLPQIETCNITVTSAIAVAPRTAIDTGKQLAVAAMLAAAHTCE